MTPIYSTDLLDDIPLVETSTLCWEERVLLAYSVALAASQAETRNRHVGNALRAIWA